MNDSHIGSINTIITETTKQSPSQMVLKNNYPNPFNDVTMIPFNVAVHCRVQMNVFDVLGKKITEIFTEFCSPGQYQVSWDGQNQTGVEVPSGNYFIVLNIEDKVYVRKMQLLR